MRSEMSALQAHDKRIYGYVPALPTPFDQAGNLDLNALEQLCELQISEGAPALAVCGTTGEAPTLSRAEQGRVIRAAAGAAKGRIPVIAGASSNSTSQAIELAKHAQEAGADAIISVVPYYNKPTQAGIYAHFRAIAESCNVHLILHDEPARTVAGLADETIARLAELPNCIGLKDASGDMARPLRLRTMVGSGFRLLSTDDATALGFFAQGGDGCISVAANVAPGLCRALYLAWQQGQIDQCQQLAGVMVRLAATLSRDTDPVPVKYVLGAIKIISPRVRLPLVELKPHTKVEIDKAVAQIAAKYSTYLIGDVGSRKCNEFPPRQDGRPKAG